jgi:hypothetical protein
VPTKKAAHKGLTVAEYRARLKAGRAKEKHFARARNAWRRIVKHRALQLREAIERRKARDLPHRVGRNRVAGGSAEVRLLYAMELAHRIFRLEYSEEGSWIKGYALTNVPAGHGYRTDCSWWGTMLRYACGLAGPSIDGGYTGSILEEGKTVTRHYAETHTGVFVIFGSGTGFHAALSKGNGTSDVFQHGVPEVDTGTFDQFGAGTEVRCRAFPNTAIKVTS